MIKRGNKYNTFRFKRFNMNGFALSLTYGTPTKELFPTHNIFSMIVSTISKCIFLKKMIWNLFINVLYLQNMIHCSHKETQGEKYKLMVYFLCWCSDRNLFSCVLLRALLWFKGEHKRASFFRLPSHFFQNSTNNNNAILLSSYMCDNFSRELVKVVVAQITQAVGFHSVSQAACEAVADILQLCMF